MHLLVEVRNAILNRKLMKEPICDGLKARPVNILKR